MRKIQKIELATYKSPDSKEKVDKNSYVLWGDKHETPKCLIEALQKSNIHRSIVFSIAQQLSGYGFTYTDANGTELPKQMANEMESFDSVLQKVAFDYEVFGGFAMEIHWNVAKTKIVRFYHQDFSRVASGKMNDKDEVETYYISSDFTKQNPDVIAIQAFNPRIETQNIQDKQLIVFKPYFPGKDYYPSPDYMSAMKWIEIDNQLAEHKVNSLINRFAAETLISTYSGVPNEEEQAEEVRNYKKNFTKSINAGEIVVEFLDSNDKKTEFTAIPKITEENKYGSMEEEKVKEIIMAHRVTDPLLVGIQSSTGFSSNADQLKTSYELFFKSVIEPKQNILQNIFKMIMDKMQINAEIEINKILPFEIQATDSAAPVTQNQNNA